MSPIEIALLVLATGLALILGFANSGLPSLWHDELVHVYVAQEIIQDGRPTLPSGSPYTNGTVYHYVLAAVIFLFGNSEEAVRAPSTVIAALNVLLTYYVCRRSLGRRTALVAGFALALSPWSVAWSRQAGFYAMQEMFFLVTLAMAWHALSAKRDKMAVLYALAAAGAYFLAVITAQTSILFLGPVGGFVILQMLIERRMDRRSMVALCLVTLMGVLTIVGYLLFLPELDKQVIFRDSRLGGDFDVEYMSHELKVRHYYLQWLYQNLGMGFFLLAMLGFILMPAREGKRGLYVALAFWVPILVLTFLLGHRWSRFMYFTFPYYVAAFSYAIVQLWGFVRRSDRSWAHGLASVLIVLFGARVAVSGALQVGDSIEVACGSNETLVRTHPQWRAPCHFVRDHLDGGAVISTTWLTADYYVGQCDEMYPSRLMPWESSENEKGSKGLRDIAELKAFMATHPKGFFLAEYVRFQPWKKLEEDRDFVRRRMVRIDEACSEDVDVYAWGYPEWTGDDRSL